MPFLVPHPPTQASDEERSGCPGHSPLLALFPAAKAPKANTSRSASLGITAADVPTCHVQNPSQLAAEAVLTPLPPAQPGEVLDDRGSGTQALYQPTGKDFRVLQLVRCGARLHPRTRRGGPSEGQTREERTNRRTDVWADGAS